MTISNMARLTILMDALEHWFPWLDTEEAVSGADVIDQISDIYNGIKLELANVER